MINVEEYLKETKQLVEQSDCDKYPKHIISTLKDMNFLGNVTNIVKKSTIYDVALEFTMPSGYNFTDGLMKKLLKNKNFFDLIINKSSNVISISLLFDE